MLFFHINSDVVVVIVYFVALPLTVVAVIKILAARANKRTRAFQAAATRIGFAFEGEDWQDKRRAPLLETALFGKGDHHFLRNILSGGRDGSRISLFDYTFVKGRGRQARHYLQTVSTFSRDDVYLPDFELRPAQIMDRSLGALTHKSIHFECDPEFTRRYSLRSPVEEKIRAIFTSSLISFLDNLDPHAKWHIEGTGNTLVIYEFRKRIPPENIPTFLDETSSIARGFFGSMGCLSG